MTNLQKGISALEPRSAQMAVASASDVASTAARAFELTHRQRSLEDTPTSRKREEREASDARTGRFLSTDGPLEALR